jgi:hypothetical protein
MSYRFLRRLLLVIACAVPLIAAESWKAKKYTEWTPAEVTKILTDSPWAKTVTAGLPDAGGMGGMGGGMGGGGGSGGLGPANADGTGSEMGGMGGGGGGGRGGGASKSVPGASNAAPQFVSATVRWASALPVKQALIKLRLGAETETSPEAKKLLDLPEPNYVVVLEGLPAGIRVDEAQLNQTLGSAAKITRKGKPAITPEKAQVQRGRQGTVVIFFFPKKDPIVLADKEVEFVSNLGRIEFKKKFKLSDMMFEGNLAI